MQSRHDGRLRRKLFALIDRTPWLDWQLVTKRPENIRRMWPCVCGAPDVQTMSLFRSNVWLLTSVSDQETAEAQVKHLLECGDLAEVLGLSIEPLLAGIDLTKLYLPDRTGWWNCLDGRLTAKATGNDGQVFWVRTKNPIRKPISWVIVGGESGPKNKVRPCWVKEIRNVLDQCKAADVPAFVKQLGSNPRVRYYEDTNLRDWAMDKRDAVCWPGGEEHSEHDGQPPPGSYIDVKLKDAKGGDPLEWPEELRVREMPQRTEVPA